MRVKAVNPQHERAIGMVVFEPIRRTGENPATEVVFFLFAATHVEQVLHESAVS